MKHLYSKIQTLGLQVFKCPKNTKTHFSKYACKRCPKNTFRQRNSFYQYSEALCTQVSESHFQQVPLKFFPNFVTHFVTIPCDMREMNSFMIFKKSQIWKNFFVKNLRQILDIFCEKIFSFPEKETGGIKVRSSRSSFVSNSSYYCIRSPL